MRTIAVLEERNRLMKMNRLITTFNDVDFKDFIVSLTLRPAI